MTTYLAPIEKPRGLFLKMGYHYTRKQFGKVAQPLSVFCARMPAAFTRFYAKIGSLDKKLALPTETAQLIREQVANTNLCLFCMDATRWQATKDSPEAAAKFDALANFEESALFTEAERAALHYATELTKDRKVSPATFTRLARFYEPREVCDIVWLVASEHLYNINNIGLNIGSEGLCDAMPADRGEGARGVTARSRHAL